MCDDRCAASAVVRRGLVWGSRVFNRSSFQFLDPGPLRDGELQLVAPNERLADLLLAAANHPMTLAMEPNEPRLNPQQLADYLAAVPGGRLKPDPSSGRVPHYDFWLYVHDHPREP